MTETGGSDGKEKKEVGADFTPKSGEGTENIKGDKISVLPWQQTMSEDAAVNTDINPGEYVLQTLFTEFTVLAQKKIDRLMTQSFERPLSKSLQRGEDPQFDQLLSSLSSVAEHCLSSLLKTLFLWYERQSNHGNEEGVPKSPNRIRSGSESPRPGSRASFREKDLLWEKRDMAVEFIFCLVLIEVLKQLSVHPVDDSLIQYIENLAFKHFKEHHINAPPTLVTCNQGIITALYAEVIGVLAQTRFQSIRRRFMSEYRENVANPQILLNITMGLKFIRIKLYPVDDVEESFMFLQECASLFLEKSLDKEVKYAFASLFVEILIPVAATAKREYSIPAVKKFVDQLYKEAFDMSKKAKHSLAIYPLVTALLCISQKQFFLSNWGQFLNMCLNSIKSRDNKMQRMAMECLYRLLWVYIIRIKCEAHTVTINRLRSIVDTLFPKSSRTILPRNIPLTIFVKIVQFIAQEKLDFAMQDIIFDLLNIGKTIKQLNPERMNIGLRAFLVIADNLQRKEGSPPMPSTIGHLPSGNTLKVKKTFTKLTEEAARNIGVVTYYTSVRRALDTILKMLDSQIGKTMTLVNPQMMNKEAQDLITGERKSKIDLFRTCVAAIPKCIPDGMSKEELVELVARLTLHVDEELRNLAFAALQSMIIDFPEYRHDIIKGYINSTLKEVPDSLPTLTENSIRMLAQLLIQWKNAIIQPGGSTTDKYLEMSMHCSKSVEDKESQSVHTLHAVEGFALAMLCSNKAMHRKLAFTLLKEVRSLYKSLYLDSKDELVIDIIENCASNVVEKALVNVSGFDKSSLGLSPHIDLHLLAEKSALLAEKQQHNVANSINRDLWSHCLSGFLDKIMLNPKHCSCMFQFIWPFVNNRIFTLYSIMDPSADFDSMKSRTSVISFRAPRIQANLGDVCLWRNYLIYLFCTPPPAVHNTSSLNTIASTTTTDTEIKTDLNKLPSDFPRLSDIFRTTVLLIRSESYEIREAAVTGLGKTNPLAHPQLIEELQLLIREVLDKKTEGVRKKRKRDLLRLQVARIMAANAEQGCFRHSLAQMDNKSILQCLGEYIEGMRSILELENDNEDNSLMQLRLYFSKFLHKMIKSIPMTMQGNLLRNQGRHHLFLLLASWCGHFNVNNLGTTTRTGNYSVELEISALEAMCALLCCGQVFDQKALTVSNGYLYKLLDTMLQSNNPKVTKLGQETVELLLENNESIPALLNFVVDRCYTGCRGISNGCFLALANVFSKHPYSCQLIALLCVVLFKTGDPSQEICEKAVQLIYILDRRFFGYMQPFRSTTAAYTFGNQACSLHLASTHPELTLPLISEITLRFESATMVGQRCLLHFLSPWLSNIELVSLSNNIQQQILEDFEFEDLPGNNRLLKPIQLEGGGWGSEQASLMVLNNLFYLTVKYEELYSKEIEDCWSSLCYRWELNIGRIIDYLIVIAGLCGTPVLVHAKKVAVYLARARPSVAISHLTEEIKLTDIISNCWERVDAPPYFRNLNKSATPPATSSSQTSARDTVSTEVADDTALDSLSSSFHNRLSIERSSYGSAKAFAETVVETQKATQKQSQIDQQKNETGSSEMWMLQWVMKADKEETGLPLPMPRELQYFAPITQLFPLTSQPAQLYRCNFALMLLAEIVSDQRAISWVQDLPLLLHVSFLGLDHPKPLVHENCKRLIINLIVVLVCGGDGSTIAKALMDFQTVSCTALNQSASARSSTIANEENENEDEEESVVAQVEVDGPELEERGLSVAERAREIIEYLAKSDCKPLWIFEDITPRNGSIKSCDQLESFLQIIVSLFDDALPTAALRGRWGIESLHWAKSCSSRHYAGRSFQIFRSLRVPLSWPMLSDILQRLLESVADSSEDVQGYFMEILHTFLAEVEFAFKERPKSVLHHLVVSDLAKARSVNDLTVSEQPHVHVRSRSIDFHIDPRKRSNSEGIIKERVLEEVNAPPVKEFSDFQLPESPYDMLTRLFWIGVSLLESDYEHEFLLAIKLIDKVIDSLNLKDQSSIERVDKVLNRLTWTNFPGVQSLLLKGLTSTGTAEQSQCLLSKLTTMDNISVISPHPNSGLPLNIIALLPRLIVLFEEPDEFCQLAAERIVESCSKYTNLKDLGLLMAMYKKKEYSKSVYFWIEVVCKNLIDAFPQLSAQLLALLVEMLEQGPPMFQQSVLNVICAILKYSDPTAPGLKQFHGHLLRVITSHVKDQNLWKEALNILKLVVSNSSQIHQSNTSTVGITSSQLVQPRGSLGSLMSLTPKLPWGSTMSFGDQSWPLSSQIFKKELPGRTLEFTYNVSNTPVIGKEEGQAEGVSQAPCWRKPHNSQRRTRERLVQLLPLCGHKGGLKQSLSVIFSSSSELELERALSSEEGSGDEQQELIEDEFSGQQLNNIFTDFDFLDDELDKGMGLEVASFGWTSNTELADEFTTSDTGHISPCGSESDNVTSAKDDYISADEEETDSLQKSLPESSLLALKEEVEENTNPEDNDEEDLEEDEDEMTNKMIDRQNDDQNKIIDQPKEPQENEQTQKVVEEDHQSIDQEDHQSIGQEVQKTHQEEPQKTDEENKEKEVDQVDQGQSHQPSEQQDQPSEPLPSSTVSASEDCVTSEATDHLVDATSQSEDISSVTSQSSFDSTYAGTDNIVSIAFPEPTGFAVLSYEEIPDRWSKIIRSFVGHPSVEEAIDSLPCFPLVLKSWNFWLLQVIRDAQNVFGISGLTNISGKLQQVEEALENEVKLPYLFIDREVFTTGKLITKHRLTALKLNVGIQSLKEKREQFQEQLELINMKLAGGSACFFELCLSIYRLHMQFVMCLEIYLAYVQRIVDIVRDASCITDVTVDLVSIRSELMASQTSTVSSIDESDQNDTTIPTFSEIADQVSEAVANRHFDEAIAIVRTYYRKRHPSLYSTSLGEIRLDEEIETILSVYARRILKSRSGVFALLGSYDQLSALCDRLSELLADFLSLAYQNTEKIATNNQLPKNEETDT